jgi:chemotaxis protein methyltransferase CheR
MEQLGMDREDEYYDRLRGGPSRFVEAELRNLLNLVTVTETCFFRDASQFRLLRDSIMPAVTAAGNRVLRIWSAGCSSGEEAYSIAMTIAEMGLYGPASGWTIEILGTDLNSAMLEKARGGIYTARAVRNVEGRLLERYFEHDGNTFRLNDEIRRRVTFEFGNLTRTAMPSTGPQDIVFCKNVAIYFRPDVAQKLMRGLLDTLTAGGFLFLGHAESLWQMSDGFTLVEHDRAFCYRKVSGAADRMTSTARLKPGPTAAATTARLKPGTTGITTTGVPPAVAIDVQYDRCLAAFRAGDWSTAESGLARIIRSWPTFMPAYLLLGGVYAHSARYDEAVTQARAVLELSDLEPRAHLLLGMVAARQQLDDEALHSLQRALYLDDSLALAHFWLGNLYRDRGDVAHACHEYENVVRHWERHTLELTEEFASDLTAEQLVAFCRDSLERLSAKHG